MKERKSLKLIIEITCPTLDKAKEQLEELRKNYDVVKFRIVSQ